MKIEYKAIDANDNIHKGIETVDSIDTLCKRLYEKNLFPIAIRVLSTTGVRTVAHMAHLKNLKSKLEHKVDPKIDYGSAIGRSYSFRKKQIDYVYIIYPTILLILLIAYLMGL